MCRRTATPTPSASAANGRLVLINAQATDLVPGDTNERWDVFVHDRSSGKTERVSVSTGGAQGKATGDPWGGSIAGGISANGRYIVFQSDAPNLVSGDTNRAADIFLHDRASGVTKRVSVGTHGQANGASGSATISASGRYVAFESAASNLVAPRHESQGGRLRPRPRHRQDLAGERLEPRRPGRLQGLV